MKRDVLSYRRSGARVLRCAIVVSCVWWGRAETVSAADRAPFSEFSSMSRGDLDSLQAKFTYVGPRFMSTPTIVVTAHGHPPELSLFTPFYRSEFSYSMDFFELEAVSVSTTALAAWIDSIDALHEVRNGGINAGPSWSFAMGNYLNGVPKVFESVLNGGNVGHVFEKLRRVAAGDALALRTVEAISCAYGLRNDSPPPDVTASVTLAFAGARPDILHHGQFVDRVRIRNTSEHAISAPLYLMLVPIGGVKLTNTDGQRCFDGPPAYFTALGAGMLRPGQSVEVRVELSNPRLEPIKYHFHQVLAGPGVP